MIQILYLIERSMHTLQEYYYSRIDYIHTRKVETIKEEGNKISKNVIKIHLNLPRSFATSLHILHVCIHCVKKQQQ